jgi:dihydrofolate reductase
MIKAIFAVDRDGGIGKGGSLPWPHDKQDMQWFSNNTRNHIVIMGSNTWLDPKMPKPLPERLCCVVSNQPVDNFRDAHYVINGDFIEQSLAVLKANNPDKDIWIIGGAKLIRSTKHLFEQIYLTVFDDNYNCDVAVDVVELLHNFQVDWETYGKDKLFQVWKRAKL